MLQGRIINTAVISLIMVILLPVMGSPIDEVPLAGPDMMTRSTDNITVSASGSGDYNNIQEAVDAAEEGATIFVWDGIYQGEVLIRKNLSLIGNGSDTTFIQGGSSINLSRICVSVLNCQVRISGFTTRYGWFGIRLANANHSVIENNICRDNVIGISLKSSFNCTIKNNYAGINWYKGIKLYSSTGCVISDNIASYNDHYGISIESDYHLSGERNLITNNTCESNKWGNIGLIFSCNDTLTNNSLMNGDIRIMGDRIKCWNTHHIDTSNTVDNRPIYFLCNVQGGKGPSGAGQIFLVNCSDFEIENQHFSYGFSGIQLAFSSGIRIIGNTFSNIQVRVALYSSDENIIENNYYNNSYGIYLDHFSERNCISNNTWKACIGCCIHLTEYCYHNMIKNNIITSTNGSGIHIEFCSSNNNIISNRILNNTENGILIDSYYNNIELNICAYNGKDGICLWGSENTLIDNTCQSNTECGLNLHGDNNKLEYNRITDNGAGIFLQSGSENIISDNMIGHNSGLGMGIDLIPGYYKSTDNLIFQNDFFDNNGGKYQAKDNGTDNRWNTTTAGNYWYYRNSPDTDGDGIVDIPYRINGSASNFDHFPSDRPFNTSLPIACGGKDITVDVNEEVRFNASNSYDDTAIINYTWSIVNGSESYKLYGISPQFRFEIPGTYTVNLTVIDEDGNVGYDRMMVEVRDQGRLRDKEDNTTVGVLAFCVSVLLLILLIHEWKKR